MSAVKFLEKKAVIRTFGVALCLAPLANALMFILLQKTTNPLYKQTFQQVSFWTVLKSGTTFHYFLAISSLIIGIIMLRGSTKAWKYVMALLGVHIIVQLTHLAENMRQSWIWGLFFVVNAGVFMFITDQLVFKLKVPEKTKANKPQDLETTKETIEKIIEPKIKKLPRVVIGFQGWGHWAELVEVNNEHIRVRRIKPPPADIEKRYVEFSFKKGVTLKAQFSHARGSEYYFTFKNVTTQDSESLDQWIDRNAA